MSQGSPEDHVNEINPDDINTELKIKNNKLLKQSEEIIKLKKQLQEYEEQSESDKAKIEDLEKRLSMTEKAEIELEKCQLKLEEYKATTYSLKSESEELNTLKSQYESLQVRYNTEKQKTKDLTIQLKNESYKLTNEHRQHINRLKKLHSQQLRNLQNELEMHKRKNNNIISKDNESYVNNLTEMQEQHDKIENELKTQIDEIKEMMEQREKSSQQIIDETNKQWDEYKKIVNQEINKLQSKLKKYEKGEVEVILKIEVDDTISSRVPPKKPAPLLPINKSGHTRDNSNASSQYSNGSTKYKEHDDNYLSPKTLPQFDHFDSAPASSVGVDDEKDHLGVDLTTIKSKNNLSKFIRNKLIKSFTPKPSSSQFKNSSHFPNTSNHSYGSPKKRKNHSSVSSHGDFYSWALQSEDGNSTIGTQEYGNILDEANHNQKRSTIATTSNTNKLLIQMYEREKANLSENLKIAYKTNLVLKEQAHRKYKQLHERLKAERTLWKDKELSYQQKIEDLKQNEKQNETKIMEKWKQLQEYEKKLLTNNQDSKFSKQAQQQITILQQQISKLTQANIEIAKESNGYKMQITQLKKTLLNQDALMKQLQETIKKLKKQNSILEYENKNLKKLQQQLEKSTKEELLEQKIQLLKNQRKALVTELKSLRERNEQLKNIIAGSKQAPMNFFNNGYQ